ncbi:MAG: outer membrane beta-barrel protein [Bacteroidota bacterium]
MKKVFILALALAMVFGLASAQDVVPDVKAGSKSLNFTFGGLGAFGLFATGPNGGIGMSYFLNNDAAVRVGLQIQSTSSTIPANPGVGQTGTDGSSSSFGLGIGADYLMYMNAGRVRPYWGGGLQFIMNSNDSKPVVYNGATQGEDKNDPAHGPTGVTFQVAGFMGAEFFIYSQLSVSAEYQLNIVNINSPADNVQSNGNNSITIKEPSTTTILGFGSGGATLHIYF